MASRSASNIVAWKCRSHAHLISPCWHARCSGCGVATAFDFSRDEAVALVASACTCTAGAAAERVKP